MTKKMKKVKVIDSMPSTGKTCWMLDHINEMDLDIKVIFITPFISETERVKNACKSRKFKLPSSKSGKGSKQMHLKDLLRKRENIASTHALFSNIDDEVIELIRDGNYMLVLDEVMNVISSLDIYKDAGLNLESKERIASKDMQLLLESGCIHIDSDYKVSWNPEKEPLWYYRTLKNYIDREQVYYASNTYLFWVFPHEIFKSDIFNEIYIMTYQFDYQIQSSYFKFFDIPYEKFGVTKTRKDRRHKWEFTFVSYDKYLDYDFAKRKQMKELINICDSDRLNEIGTRNKLDNGKGELLSKSDYDARTPEEMRLVQRKAISYLSRHLGDRSSDMMWTVFKAHQSSIKDTRFPVKHFVPLNARATNDYSDKASMIYLVNRFTNPFMNNLLLKRGVRIDQDTYALAEMLQWIFRGRLRNDEPIDIFIPSERMRNLLIKWLEGEY